MPAERLRIGELLVEAGVLTKEQLAEALQIQKEEGRRLGTVLLGTGLVSEAQLVQALSRQLSVPWVSVSRADPPDSVLQLVPPMVASQYGLVPVYVRHVRGEGESLYVAMDDPTNTEALRAVSAASGMPVQPMVAAPSEIARAIIEYYEDEEATGQIRLPSPLREAAEASGRHTLPTMTEVPGRRGKRDTIRDVAADDAPTPPPEDTDEVIELEEEYIVVGPAPPEEWEGSQSAGAVFSPGVERDEQERRVLPEALETAHHLSEHVVEEDTDKYVLPEARGRARGAPRRAGTPREDDDADHDTDPARQAPAERPRGGRSSGRDGAEDDLEPGTVDEKLETIEARIAAAEGQGRDASPKRKKKRRRRSVSVTLLDGTRIDFGKGREERSGPTGGPRPISSVSELVGLLRASGRGEALPKKLPSVAWETFVADLIELLVSKGVLTEEEILKRLLR